MFCQLKFNICVRCDMAFIEPMHRNKPNITYLLTYYGSLQTQYFSDIWAEKHTCNLKIIHWDLRHNACQYPCDLTVKPCEKQPKETQKCCTKMYHNFYFKKYVIWRHLFNNFLSVKHWIHKNNVGWNIDENRNILTPAKWRPVCVGINVFTHFRDYTLHCHWNKFSDTKHH